MESQHLTTTPTKEYTAGKYFGELGMLTARPRAAWIMAKTYCVLSVPSVKNGMTTAWFMGKPPGETQDFTW